MRKLLPIYLLVCLPAAAQVAPIPAPTQLSSNPFFVKKSWPIGGNGNWDYLTMDPVARRLYIAHGHAVQVVDVDSGSVVGEITGFREAHAIALDDTGTFAYVSDGQEDAIKVIDRRSLAVEATIGIGCSPRSITFEPRSRLVFAICSATQLTPRVTPPGKASVQPASSGISHVVAIDAEKRSILADLAIPGDFRFAQADGDGNVYSSVGSANYARVVNVSRQQIAHEVTPQGIAKLDAVGIASEANHELASRSQPTSAGPIHWDLDEDHNSQAFMHFTKVNSSTCANLQGLAIDSRHQRLFLACDNQQFVVLDSGNGNVIASYTTGPGDDVLAYDQDRGLIFVASGGGYGSLTIIQQDANTDSYAVIQNLPTLERARTLAVDPSNGLVYLVTDLHGVDLTKMGGVGTLHSDPIQGSFQVMVVGH